MGINEDSKEITEEDKEKIFEKYTTHFSDFLLNGIDTLSSPVKAGDNTRQVLFD